MNTDTCRKNTGLFRGVRGGTVTVAVVCGRHSCVCVDDIAATITTIKITNRQRVNFKSILVSYGTKKRINKKDSHNGIFAHGHYEISSTVLSPAADPQPASLPPSLCVTGPIRLRTAVSGQA
ncbi:hypothetical protein RvY_14370-2 [Ramazzottius varieornatus]|nr:hypothetical protein RvY_14370-2 [Ramazzottius varieornatus]